MKTPQDTMPASVDKSVHRIFNVSCISKPPTPDGQKVLTQSSARINLVSKICIEKSEDYQSKLSNQDCPNIVERQLAKQYSRVKPCAPSALIANHRMLSYQVDVNELGEDLRRNLGPAVWFSGSSIPKPSCSSYPCHFLLLKLFLSTRRFLASGALLVALAFLVGPKKFTISRGSIL